MVAAAIELFLHLASGWVHSPRRERHGTSLPHPSPTLHHHRVVQLQEAAKQRRSRRATRPPASPAVQATDTPGTGQEAPPSPLRSGGNDDDAFDWLDQWYPFAPVCDLDPGAPHGKTVLGLRVVAWHDTSGTGSGDWLVFDDACPHRLAPLSEGRIDGQGRLQCVYHGWCFDGAGVHPPGAGARPAGAQEQQGNKILWFYPRTEPEHKDVLQKKRPPYFAEINDPSFVTVFGMRDLFYADGKAAAWFMLVAFCIPVAPGRSRLIWAFPRNAGVWLHKIIPRWFSHSEVAQVRMLVTDVWVVAPLAHSCSCQTATIATTMARRRHAQAYRKKTHVEIHEKASQAPATAVPRPAAVGRQRPRIRCRPTTTRPHHKTTSFPRHDAFLSCALAADRSHHAMDLLLPRAGRHSPPFPVAPLSFGRPKCTTAVLPPGRRRRRCGGRPSASAAATETTPRSAEDTPSPSSPGEEGAFDWLDQWYPFAPVCDLDPGAPHGKTVLGLSVVAWYDRAAGEWRVFDDACPHRLAPLSEGRIDDKSRLQCVYHGWCFDGAGACNKACVASYPCVVQNNILWFYPRAEPEYKGVLQRKRPPLIPEIDDPEFVTVYGIRDLPYGSRRVRCVRHGVLAPMKIEEANIEGFVSPQELGYFQFIAPSTIVSSPFSRPQEEQGGLGVPEERWGLAPQDHTTMVVPLYELQHCAQGQKALEVALQIASVAVVGFLAVSPVTNGTVVMSTIQRATVVGTVVLCFAADEPSTTRHPEQNTHRLTGTGRGWPDGDRDSAIASPTTPAGHSTDHTAFHSMTHSCALAAAHSHAMEPLSLHLLPHSGRHFPPFPAAASPLRSALPKRTSATVAPPPGRRRRRCAQLLMSAAATETPPQSAEDAPSPSPPAGEDPSAFDWLDQWYPFAPVCDLDPGAPHGKTVLGFSVVAWYGRAAGDGDGEWRVFDDACPHRLAPLSEGRIDDKGRLQCVYHGWCFDGAGACKFIPQAPALGPPVHKNDKACVASYPCVVQNKILRFYPRAEAEYRDVLQRKRPPYTRRSTTRPSSPLEQDKEGGGPIKLKIEEASMDGFLSSWERGHWKFVAPCTFYSSGTSMLTKEQQGKKKAPRFMLVVFCVPVGPGRSRLIWAFPRNFAVWLDMIIPRWFYHINQNSVLDSDAYILHVENWQNVCYVPASSDTMVVAFRNWFRKYCKNRVGWATPHPDQLPPTPTKDACSSCSAALKAMRALEVALQVSAVAVVGFLAVAKETLSRGRVCGGAVLCRTGAGRPGRRELLADRLIELPLPAHRPQEPRAHEITHALPPHHSHESSLLLATPPRLWPHRAMDTLPFLPLVRASRPPLPLAAPAAPLRCRRLRSGARIAQSPGRRGARLPVSAVATETARSTEDAPSPSPSGQERFDWLDQWYPLAPMCDLDPRAPHGKTVLGLSVVAWYDRSGAGSGEWRVFDDACPHRLAPLSEGRIDDKGRLQCVYHGWCFDGAGACKFIPQAPALGPPVHKNTKACVASYPCVVQNNILWFYPRAEPEYKDVLQRKRPPLIPEIDDPEFVTVYGIRDLPYGEGGGPIKMKIKEANIEGFVSPQERGYFQFIAPSTLGNKKAPRLLLVFFCIPVAPGRSRVIWAFPRNVGVWLHKITPRWLYHAALKAMKALEVALQVASVAVVGFLAIANGTANCGRVHGRAMLRGVPMAGELHREDFYFQDYIHAYK
ncbi:hypothetical protein HU200_003106 [Digitaria exilis]|uniref:Rieske domain-containing protein n=1 Tax=Digitaria exilis TaxID=1010633 RepID=A0A835FVX2_9POAL|nr:hypothetical protein HU200_003106 [Digitaria exilis]